MEQQMESEGSNVAEAVESALKKLGLRRDQVEVQVIQEGSSGFMGIGRKPAKVRVVEKRWGTEPPPTPAAGPRKPGGREHDRGPGPRPPGEAGRSRDARPHRPDARPARPESHRPRPETHHPRPETHHARPEPRPAKPAHAPRPQAAPRTAPDRGGPETPGGPREPLPTLADEAEIAAACAQATDLIKEILRLMRFTDAKVQAQWDPEQERIKALVETAEAEQLIGKEGKVLESLQFLVTVITTRQAKKPVAVWVDTMGYLERREQAVLREALKGLDIVRQTKKPFRLSPMDPAMRRLVHRSLEEHADVSTSSEGEGQWRKVVIRPR
ncbi:MAG: Jag N-terminal domain-containing protein [Elusimicrobia bacterium]|nr:Jag N-terminal domain-containing protein [Elusimicrobiota bacterium]